MKFDTSCSYSFIAGIGNDLHDSVNKNQSMSKEAFVYYYGKKFM